MGSDRGLQEQPRGGHEPTERYTHGYDGRFVEYLEARSVETEAAFLVPHLQYGMSLLDCGCGPGSITAGLAGVIAPGVAIGIDIDAGQVEIARQMAAAQAIPNLRFETANIYAIPFPDESFDAVFVHTVLQHLVDPAKALREIHRVLKPGGVVGMREEDTAGIVFAPMSAILEEGMELYVRTWRHNGGDPYFARHHRAFLHACGFVRTVGSASADCYGTPQTTRAFGTVMTGFFAQHLAIAVEMGWIKQEKLEQISRAWEEWGEDPDAFFAMLRCEAVGWKA